ncbi:unnamed protein product, partial [Ectocarpus sp. 4 AP-2014]
VAVAISVDVWGRRGEACGSVSRVRWCPRGFHVDTFRSVAGLVTAAIRGVARKPTHTFSINEPESRYVPHPSMIGRCGILPLPLPVFHPQLFEKEHVGNMPLLPVQICREGRLFACRSGHLG